MVFLSCCSYAANRAFSIIAPGRTDIVSAAGAFVVGVLGNVYSRGIRGTAFTTMVTGVLFLVPASVQAASFSAVLVSDRRTVWYCSRRGCYPDVPHFGRAIFQRVLASRSDDHGRCWGDYWLVCESIHW